MKYLYIIILLMKDFFINIGNKILIKSVMKYKTSNYIPTTQYVKYNKNQQIYSEFEKEKIISENEFIKNKKLITISPGGYKGIYLLGTSMYIRDNFDLDNYIFSGASAGAWTSLMMCYKKDALFLKNEVVDYSLNNCKTPYEIENMMKQKILEKCSVDDFDLNRLFIGVTTLYRYNANTTIFSDFISLEDAVNCCIASSHIPLVTGGLMNRYSNLFTFDAGFSKYPYLNISESVLHINPGMWIKKKENPGIVKDISEYTTLFSRDKFDFKKLYEEGFEDARKNKVYLKYKLGNELE
jgi:hypothetical protein